MDISEIKNAIHETQMDLLGRAIDGRTLTYWVNVISNREGTIDDFVDNIITSNEYILNITNVFKDELYSLVGYGNNNELEIEYFKNSVYKQIKETKKPFSKRDMINLICKLDCFKNKYANIIKTEYNSVFNSNCDDNYIDYYLDKFRTSFDLNTEMLLDAIRSNHIIDSIVENVHDIYTPTNLINENNIELNTQYVELFFKTFERPMFVEEYFYYVIKNKIYNFEDIHEKYVLNMNTFTNITIEYTNKIPNEYTFVKKYLLFNESNKYDEDFFRSVIDEAVTSIEYENEMKRIVTSKYYAMYNENLENDDILYYFSRIKQLKLNLQDDTVEGQIVKLKTETDLYIRNIFEIYTTVLDRKPDVNEIGTLLSKYRTSGDSDIVNNYLEIELVKSIEFNEIIKKKIQESFLEKFNKEILPSKLYAIMRICIKDIENSNMLFADVCLQINEFTF